MRRVWEHAASPPSKEPKEQCVFSHSCIDVWPRDRVSKTLPDLTPGPDGVAPQLPRGAYAEDYRDDWIAVVSRRLAKKIPDLNSAQRRVLAGIAFQRRYRTEAKQCTVCHGNGWYLTENDGGNITCEICHGRGEVRKVTARYVGRDARTRPVVERLEYGRWVRWAVGREGQPVDVAEPVTEGKPY